MRCNKIIWWCLVNDDDDDGNDNDDGSPRNRFSRLDWAATGRGEVPAKRLLRQSAEDWVVAGLSSGWFNIGKLWRLQRASTEIASLLQMGKWANGQMAEFNQDRIRAGSEGGA
jgi:hypothetical protein